MPVRKPHHIADSNKRKAIRNGYEFLPRGLNIVWGSDPRYWNLPAENDDISPAALIQVSWLEVSGSVPVSKGKKYRITFDVSLKPDSFGWNGSQVLVMAKIGKKGSYEYKEVSLNGGLPRRNIPDDEDPLIIEIGQNAQDPEIHFGLYEVWSGRWKGGLEIHKATVVEVE